MDTFEKLDQAREHFYLPTAGCAMKEWANLLTMRLGWRAFLHPPFDELIAREPFRLYARVVRGNKRLRSGHYDDDPPFA